MSTLNRSLPASYEPKVQPSTLVWHPRAIDRRSVEVEAEAENIRERYFGSIDRQSLKRAESLSQLDSSFNRPVIVTPREPWRLPVRRPTSEYVTSSGPPRPPAVARPHHDINPSSGFLSRSKKSLMKLPNPFKSAGSFLNGGKIPHSRTSDEIFQNQPMNVFDVEPFSDIGYTGYESSTISRSRPRVSEIERSRDMLDSRLRSEHSDTEILNPPYPQIRPTVPHSRNDSRYSSRVTCDIPISGMRKSQSFHRSPHAINNQQLNARFHSQENQLACQAFDVPNYHERSFHDPEVPQPHRESSIEREMPVWQSSGSRMGPERYLESPWFREDEPDPGLLPTHPNGYPNRQYPPVAAAHFTTRDPMPHDRSYSSLPRPRSQFINRMNYEDTRFVQPQAELLQSQIGELSAKLEQEQMNAQRERMIVSELQRQIDNLPQHYDEDLLKQLEEAQRLRDEAELRVRELIEENERSRTRLQQLHTHLSTLGRQPKKPHAGNPFAGPQMEKDRRHTGPNAHRVDGSHVNGVQSEDERQIEQVTQRVMRNLMNQKDLAEECSRLQERVRSLEQQNDSYKKQLTNKRVASTPLDDTTHQFNSSSNFTRPGNIISPTASAIHSQRSSRDLDNTPNVRFSNQRSSQLSPTIQEVSDSSPGVGNDQTDGSMARLAEPIGQNASQRMQETVTSEHTNSCQSVEGTLSPSNELPHPNRPAPVDRADASTDAATSRLNGVAAPGIAPKLQSYMSLDLPKYRSGHVPVPRRDQQRDNMKPKKVMPSSQNQSPVIDPEPAKPSHPGAFNVDQRTPGGHNRHPPIPSKEEIPSKQQDSVVGCESTKVTNMDNEPDRSEPSSRDAPSKPSRSHIPASHTCEKGKKVKSAKTPTGPPELPPNHPSRIPTSPRMQRHQKPPRSPVQDGRTNAEEPLNEMLRNLGIEAPSQHNGAEGTRDPVYHVYEPAPFEEQKKDGLKTPAAPVKSPVSPGMSELPVPARDKPADKPQKKSRMLRIPSLLKRAPKTDSSKSQKSPTPSIPKSEPVQPTPAALPSSKLVYNHLIDPREALPTANERNLEASAGTNPFRELHQPRRPPNAESSPPGDQTSGLNHGHTLEDLRDSDELPMEETQRGDTPGDARGANFLEQWIESLTPDDSMDNFSSNDEFDGQIVHPVKKRPPLKEDIYGRCGSQEDEALHHFDFLPNSQESQNASAMQPTDELYLSDSMCGSGSGARSRHFSSSEEEDTMQLNPRFDPHIGPRTAAATETAI